MTEAGYSGTPLVKKLGLKDGQRVLIRQAPSHYFELLGGIPDIIQLEEELENTADFIHLFCTQLVQLERHFTGLKKVLKPSGMFWISWPKGKSDIPTDLNGTVVRNFGLVQGLVDVKICAVDKDWSALKFMYRLKDRK